MTDPKAPLPQDVEIKLESLAHYVAESDEHLDNISHIRAHIAAQAERIAELEAELARLRTQKPADFKHGVYALRDKELD